MSDTAPYNTSEIDEAVTRLMETREKFLYTLYEQRIAAAVAAERERCCRDVCPDCADGIPANFIERPDWGAEEDRPTWTHWHGPTRWTVCRAAAIRRRARAGEGEQVPMSDNASCET